LKKAEIFNESYWVFLDMYTTGRVTDYGYIPTGTKNANKLKTLLAKFMLRRKKDDVMKDLPPISFCDVAIERSSVDLHPYFSSEINVTGDATTFLAQLKNSSLALKSALDSICTTQKTQLKDILSLLQGLEVSQATLRRYIGMAKVPTFCELISAELDDNPKMKIVIFAVHKSVIESISKMLAKYKPVTLNGSTATEKRQANIDKFQNDPVCRVFIGNIKAAGTGITLTTASEVAFIEASYTPADNAQAAMRCHRIGQTKHVRVRFFACAGSDDELIMNVLRRKTAELAKIF
jgi:SWI/SNF-related matrix-associated actin-dependent regulator 1 of chromatin subfamily A